MDISNSVAVVTGANRGFGRHLATQLLRRGAKVYAGARDPETVDLPGAVALRLDVTDPASVARAAAQAPDATFLINNAGLGTAVSVIDGDLTEARQAMETNFWGTLATTRAFAPVLAGNGGGAILNVLSVLSWVHPKQYGGYGASKAAAWAVTNATRDELSGRGITVTALHVGYMDTDMAGHIPADQKTDPALIAAITLDGVEAGLTEILADDLTRTVKAGLAA